ncbi:MAG TPA: hypothetical protein VGL93_30205 [Streptosporangiaceae bacterium]|jgi:hypothetical protein
MAVRKYSVSLDESVAERAERAAAYEGMTLSAWLTWAADELAGLAEARKAFDEYVATYGEFDKETVEQARRDLNAAGVGLPETPEDERARLAALARLRGGWGDGEDAE